MSAKNLDGRGRFRRCFVGIRMSPEEKELLDNYAALCGLNKQDYLIDRALRKDITVENSPKIYKALNDKLTQILTELRRINCGDISEEMNETIRFIAGILGEMK
jgi:hypothetical protein